MRGRAGVRPRPQPQGLLNRPRHSVSLEVVNTVSEIEREAPDKRWTCYRCGRTGEIDAATRIVLTRLDPRTRRERIPTPLELQAVEGCDGEIFSLLHLARLGFRISVVCAQCSGTSRRR